MAAVEPPPQKPEQKFMRFRPCIDLHAGVVKQIVGSTLTDAPAGENEEPITNFETEKSSAEYARMYKEDNLPGGHVIMLGGGNEEAALAALREYPGGMQIGGGVTAENAASYIEAGASHVIVTSYVFKDGKVAFDRLQTLLQLVGKEKLVLDLSCRKKPPPPVPAAQSGDPAAPGGEAEGKAAAAAAAEVDDKYYVVTDRWQKYTDFAITQENLYLLAQYCDEFLVHGVEAEGKRAGMLEDLVAQLGAWSPVRATYAGGARALRDLDRVKELGGGKVDLTIGSALDCFGGDLSYRAVVDWQRRQEAEAEEACSDHSDKRPRPAAAP
eukprot:CAMPEP_0194725198 /NCGR_PEP_ID=MMETSP0296-20130528/25843_1 /TAXON_ID=39354 /ORGANISM="Heterosigma akashiwo, Strain CCMP2393" /LENGTH=325 /DNA_ID=CAMNT_0039629569 /DNA_START=35 /DNA_END=1008 /DNA_ORIENTATION=-